MDEVIVLWASSDKEVATKMVFMYSVNSKLKGWWDKVTLVIWGPSAKLLAEDEEIQRNMQLAMEAGVKVQACQACSDLYGVSDKLRKLGVEVFFIGKTFTEYLKNNKVITI